MIGKPFTLIGAFKPYLLLLIISILSYGAFVTKLGFFWDDWGGIYTWYAYGAKGFWAYVSDRPLDNYYYICILNLSKSRHCHTQTYAY